MHGWRVFFSFFSLNNENTFFPCQKNTKNTSKKKKISIKSCSSRSFQQHQRHIPIPPKFSAMNILTYWVGSVMKVVLHKKLMPSTGMGGKSQLTLKSFWYMTTFKVIEPSGGI
jgi:hypothetical protein